jgi:hypothetical protein
MYQKKDLSVFDDFTRGVAARSALKRSWSGLSGLIRASHVGAPHLAHFSY